MCNIPYHEAVGSLMYASLRTWLDITYAIQTLSHFSTKPRTAHWEAIKHVSCYLKGTKELWLLYGEEEKKLVGYTDVDGNMAEDCHAILGYTVLIHEGAILWTTKRQEIISVKISDKIFRILLRLLIFVVF